MKIPIYLLQGIMVWLALRCKRAKEKRFSNIITANREDLDLMNQIQIISLKVII